MLEPILNEVKSNSELSKLRYDEFLIFQNEFKIHATPALNHINNLRMQKQNESLTSIETRDASTQTEICRNWDEYPMTSENIIHPTYYQHEHDDINVHYNSRHSMNNDVRMRYPNDSSGVNNNNNNNVPNNMNNSTRIDINCDVLLMGDSNIKDLQPEIMNNGSECFKIQCYHLLELSNIINRMNVQKAPTKVFIQTGTNDLEKQDVNFEVLSTEFDKAILLIKTKFNNPEIIVSSILPRKDQKDKIKTLNNILENYCDVTPKLKFMRNDQIEDTMLSDRKHLNIDGFFKLLANIRYALFGKLPKGPRRNNTYSSNQRYNHQRNRVGDQYGANNGDRRQDFFRNYQSEFD